MSFAKKYFQRVNTLSPIIEAKVPNNLGMIVVVPVYNEPDLRATVDSLLRNDFSELDEYHIELIFVVNSSEDSLSEVKDQNKRTLEELEQIKKQNRLKNLQIYAIEMCNLPAQKHGAGFARKIGMDEALQRFDKIDNAEGIIVSLDADTLVEKNYFKEIKNFFENNKKICGANISFEHPTEGNEYDKKIYEAIEIYEIYLRYYVEALRYTGFPYSFHTIGSAFCVRADTYAKQGGMVVNKSGEDFYFLQKVITSCNYGQIKTTRVYPSPRYTNRVIFGTGVAVREIIEKYNFLYPTYRFEAFENLREFFLYVPFLYQKLDFKLLKMDNFLKEYLYKIGIEEKIEEIRKNTGNEKTFEKRFYRWFGALKILQYLNFLHSAQYEKNELLCETRKLLRKKYQINLKQASEILAYLREQQN